MHNVIMSPEGLNDRSQTSNMNTDTPIHEIIPVVSKVCFVCDEHEFSNAKMVDRSAEWICPTCRSILKSIIQNRRATESIQNQGIIPHHD